MTYGICIAQFSEFWSQSRLTITYVLFQGEFCVCSSRIFVQEGIYDEFVTKFARNAKGITVGDPFDPSTIQGPQVIKTWIK